MKLCKDCKYCFVRRRPVHVFNPNTMGQDIDMIDQEPEHWTCCHENLREHKLIDGVGWITGDNTCKAVRCFQYQCGPKASWWEEK